VETGLRIMQKDGSFDAIFNKYHQDAIEAEFKRTQRYTSEQPAASQKYTGERCKTLYVPSGSINCISFDLI
jgi:hypothetical protein